MGEIKNNGFILDVKITNLTSNDAHYLESKMNISLNMSDDINTFVFRRQNVDDDFLKKFIYEYIVLMFRKKYSNSRFHFMKNEGEVKTIYRKFTKIDKIKYYMKRLIK